MSQKYYCKFCDFYTNYKSDFTRHTRTSKHIKQITACSDDVDDKVNKMDISLNDVKSNETSCISFTEDSVKFKCIYCDKLFTRKSSMDRHVRYTCKNSNDEDMKELVRLLNKRDCSNNNKIFQMQNQIKRLTKKLQLTNIINTGSNVLQGNINNSNNVSLLAYDQTTHKFLHDRDYIRSIKDCNYCVKTFIEKVHFNAAHPENMNVYISSIKANHIMVYKNNRWNIVDRYVQLENMYLDNEFQIESWYGEYKDQYPEIIQSFNRYLHNKEENELMNRVKKEILFMLYNKRHQVTENYKNMKLRQEYQNLLDAENAINEVL